MLQIRKLFSILFFMFIAPAALSGQTQALPEWMMEDAFDGEYVKPFDVDVVSPQEVKTALELYSKGNYLEALGFLKKIRELNLPDGRLDIFAFAIAECNRMLKLDQMAIEEYTYVASRFSSSDKVPPSLFRLMEYAVKNNEFETADSLYQSFTVRFAHHPLNASVKYTMGRAFYIQKQYDDALTILNTIPESSARTNQARFLSALCFIAVKQYQKAIGLLDLVINSGNDMEMKSEAVVITGDCYYLLNNIPEALNYYTKVPKKASRYKYSIIKAAKATLDLKQFRDAQKIAEKFLKKERSGEHFFEMATILELAYSAGKNESSAAKVSDLIHGQLIDSRVVFEIYEEIDKLTDLKKSWQIREYDAIRSNDAITGAEAQKNQKKIDELRKKFHILLTDVNPAGTENSVNEIPHLAERRYLVSLKKLMQDYEDSITIVKNEIELKGALIKGTIGNSYVLDSLEDVHGHYMRKFEEHEHEYMLVEKECFGTKSDRGSQDEEMQARFVDWAFIKYQDRSSMIASLAQKLSDMTKQAKSDSLPKDSSELLSVKDEYSKNTLAIVDDRKRLIKHIEKMLEVYPKNRFNSNILFRLAELYYDQAGELFQAALRDYEARIASGVDTAGIEFPDYNLDKVIRIYDDIIQYYPFDELADNACFYKALALQKQGLNEEANDALIELTEKYPESEFYAEANMNMGRFYFEHPKIENDQGYRLAEEAYRKVLYFRDHPQYVQALYHLGWCYYMQDRFEEAIAAFKYLVEENKLDFDPSKMDEQQVVNPLLRGEAIDYIAISFDEEGRVDEAVKFLQLIGNADYSAMVLKRIAELREEDLDYGAAVSVYKRLLDEYSLSSIAPEASMNLIKLYDGRSMPDSAMNQREKFFNLYSNGSIWQEAMNKDSALLNYIDSLSVVMGLYVADAFFRNAEENKSRELYLIAADKYRKIVEKYPESALAAEARWNLAAILDMKINDKPAAYTNYIRFSKLAGVDPARREQAALNAIALAQSILPSDSAVQSGNIDFAAGKVIEAVDNYNSLFPSGNSAQKVLMTMAAIYFNRQLFSKAADIYTRVVKSNPDDKKIFFEAQLLLGQCRFGEENWSEASVAFEIVWKQSDDQAQRSNAYKLLLQSEFYFAKGVMNSGDFEKAAVIFRSIEDRFPGSEYGDIVLFNASEAYEKMEKWQQAADNYLDLVKKFPQSKYAPDGLFNAALNYEKVDKVNKSAEAYEMIVNDYGNSEKAKDALFNLGFCYEKMGKMDKVAETNERYSHMYPGEKDVEAMLLRSAAFYARTGMYDKATVVYKNFVRRYPKTPKAVEALFMIAKCNYDQGDMENALLGFNNAEQQNNNMMLDGFEPNNFYAAEAAYHAGLIKRDRFLSVRLTLPEDQLKRNLKEKSDLLSDAAKSFQRVIQYQSERMFEAAYKVGELYEEFAIAIKEQERAKLDPIKSAVSEKEIQTLAFQMIQKTFVPYTKVVEIASGFDSLTDGHKMWIGKAKSGLERNIMNAGSFLILAVQAMQNAPIPKEVKEKILHNFQYQKQVLETLEPFKEQICQYYKISLHRVDSLKLSDSLIDACRNQYARVLYLKGADFDNLSKQILSSTQNLPGNITASEKEELIFQLEDIVFELQDKSILLFDSALESLKSIGMNSGRWHASILECLARLNPDKYGTAFYTTVAVGTDESWVVRPDSINNWNGAKIPQDGWNVAQTFQNPKVSFENATCVWGDTSLSKVYTWKNIFLSGVPRDGSIYIKSPGKYKLFINAILILSDTIGNRRAGNIDSATGITSLLKGGDNVIAAEVAASDSVKGVAIRFTALLDTTQKFQTSAKVPQVLSRSRESQSGGRQVADSLKTVKNPLAANKTQNTDNTARTTFKTSKAVVMAIEEYRKKESQTQADIKKEQLEIQNLKAKIAEIDTALQKGK